MKTSVNTQSTVKYCAAICVLFLLALSVPAATITWNAASGSDIGTAANWTGGVLPSASVPDTAQWNNTPAGALSLTSTNTTLAGAAGNAGINLSMTAINTGSLSIDSGLFVNNPRFGNVTLASGAGAFTLGDGANTFGITLGGAPSTQTWQNDSANTATINSDVAFSLGGSAAHTLALAGAGNWTFNNALGNGGGTLTLTKTGKGTATLTGANGYTGATTVNQGVLTVSGSGGISASTTINVGATAAQAGAMYQTTSGTVANTSTGGGAFQIGGAVGAWGYYSMASGTLNIAGEIDPGGSGGGAGTFGRFDMSGGTVNLPNNANSYFLPNRGAIGESSVVNISGGTIQITGSGTPADGGFNGLSINWAAGSQTNATTLSGSAQFLTPSLRVKLNQGTSFNGLGVNGAANFTSLNLNGGTLQTLGFLNGAVAVNPGVNINFNGGTLKAGTAANATFLTGLAGTYIYSGGATIDDNGQAITIGQAMLAPGGNGVTSIPVATGGAGYLVPPQVIITGGGGATATAYAQISGAGVVTNIVVSNAGINYSSLPTVTLSAVGATTAATLGTVTTAANTSGGLTKQGSGTTTISSAGSTYTGNVNINQGTLAVTAGNNNGAPTSSGLGNPAVAHTVTVNGATLALSSGDNMGSTTFTPLITLVVTNGGVITNLNTFFTTLGPVTLNGGTLAGGGGAVAGYQTFFLRGTVTVGGIVPSTIAASGSFPGIHLLNPITFNVADATGNANTDLTVSGQLRNQTDTQGGAAGGVTKTGLGTMLLTGANTYSGGTLHSAGTLLIGNSSALGTGLLTMNGGSISNVSGNSYTIANNVSLASLANVGVNNGDTLTFAGVITNTAGLTKAGGGTLTLSGANSYGGTTTISAGKLFVSSAQSGTGAMAVNDGTTLRVTVSGVGQLSPSTLTLGSSAGPTTNDFSGVSSTTTAPVNATALVLNGLTTLNIVSANFSSGQIYPLINFTSISGAGGFVLGTLPVNVIATVVTNGSAIALNVSFAPTTIWTGNANTTWDILTTNWNVAGSASTYVDGATVRFDDTATTPAVVVTSTVSPAGITVSNSALSYAISGSPIAGSGTLTKIGGGTLTLSGTNTYSGGTVISNGTVVLNSPVSTLAAAGAVNVSGGTLSIGANNETVGAVTLTSGTIAGTSGILTGSSYGLQNGSVSAGLGGTAALSKTTTSTVTLSGTNNYSGGTTVSAGTLNVSGSVSNSPITTVGNAANNAALNVSGNLNQKNLLVGNASGAVGVVYQTGGTVIVTNGGGDCMNIGNLAGGFGYYKLTAGTVLANGLAVGGENNNGSGFSGTGGDGIMDIIGGTVNDIGWLVMARGAAAETGVLNVFGGTLNYAGGGIVNCWGTGQTGIVNIMGGSVANTTDVGFNVNQSGNAANTAILNLNGGVAQANSVIGNNARLNFNGGTLKASKAITAYISNLGSANIYSGGATINNNGFAVTNAQPLLAPTGSGVTGIASFTAGTGYIAPPIVTVVRGGGDTTGVGATAIAQIDVTAGTVTNILITCPGVNYTATPTFTLAGGGATSAATVTGVAPTANISGGLTSTGAGTLTLTGVSTYTNATVVSTGTLALNGSGSISNSKSITTTDGATFDVSAVTGGFTLVSSQRLLGSGTNNGAVTAASGSSIYAGTDGGYGTNTFNNSLTLAAGATINLDLGDAYNASNDLVKVTGTVTLNNTAFRIKAPSVADNLDTAADYVLLSATTLSGPPASTPAFDVAPLNAAHYSVGASGNTVVLHYNVNTLPTASGTASPAVVVRNQSTFISVTVTPGNNGVSDNAITSVTLNTTTIGGPAAVPLVLSDVANVYTNTVIVDASAAAGGTVLTATVTDTVANTGSASIALTVNAGGEVWNGGAGDAFWSSGANWMSSRAPGYTGDSLVFAGVINLTPSMQTNYSVTGLTFDSTAGSFNIGSANSSALTLTSGGGVVNNSANAQTVNVPVTTSSAQTFNAAGGALTFGQNITNGGNLVTVTGPFNSVVNGGISGAGGLTKTGNGTLTLSGISTFSGAVTITGGTVVDSGAVSNSALSTIGNAAGSNAVLRIAGGDFNAGFNSGQIYNSSLNLGTAATAGGFVEMSSGTFEVHNQLALGTAGYGAFTQTGGATTIGGFIACGATTNGGVVNLTGGSITCPISPITIGYGSSSIAAMNVSGAAALTLNGSGGFFGGGLWPGEVGTGALNVFDSAAVTVTGDSIILGKANGTASKGLVNLLGGTTTANSVSKGTGTGILGFNGGTLKANINTASFLSGLTLATIYANGAVIDDGGFTVTASQALLAPTGNGVTAISLAAAGTGYLDTPLVTISGGGGSNATAIAQINYTAGTVTNILITSPGNGYAGVPTVALVGGGGSGATIDTVTIGASTSGGLTKLGAGTLILNGTSTYAGNTTISNGILALGGAGSIAGSSNISIFSGAIFDVTAVAGFTLGAGQTLKGNGSVNGTVIVNGTIAPGNSIGTLTFSNSPTLSGTVLMEINTTNFPATNDLLVASGNPLVFGGTLTVVNVGPAPVGGDTFTLFNAASYSGAFSVTNLPALNAGLGWYLGNLTVNGSLLVNNLPVVSAIALAAQSGMPVTVKIIGGKHPPTDADGDLLTVTAVGYTSGNGATVTTDGTKVTYTADAGFTGADSFTYTVTDAKGGSTTAVVSVTVSAAGEGFNRLSPPSPIGNGTVVLSYLGVPGYNYALDWATNLAAPINWLAVGTNTAGPTGALNFTNTSTEAANYFRTRSVP